MVKVAIINYVLKQHIELYFNAYTKVNRVAQHTTTTIHLEQKVSEEQYVYLDELSADVIDLHLFKHQLAEILVENKFSKTISKC